VLIVESRFPFCTRGGIARFLEASYASVCPCFASFFSLCMFELQLLWGNFRCANEGSDRFCFPPRRESFYHRDIYFPNTPPPAPTRECSHNFFLLSACVTWCRPSRFTLYLVSLVLLASWARPYLFEVPWFQGAGFFTPASDLDREPFFFLLSPPPDLLSYSVQGFF